MTMLEVSFQTSGTYKCFEDILVTNDDVKAVIRAFDELNSTNNADEYGQYWTLTLERSEGA